MQWPALFIMFEIPLVKFLQQRNLLLPDILMTSYHLQGVSTGPKLKDVIVYYEINLQF